MQIFPIITISWISNCQLSSVKESSHPLTKNSRKSSGPDQLSPRVPKECAVGLAPSLCSLFNSSFDTGQVSLFWKITDLNSYISEPTDAPKNVSGHNTSSTSIFVTWNDVPAPEQNGIITSYNISYRSLTENHSNSTTVDFPVRQVNLTGLKEFVNYSITVSASTKIGPGPASKPVIVSTGEDSK